MANRRSSRTRFTSGITAHSAMALFKREDGFFVGAILANVVTTELVILLVCFFFLLIVGANV